MINVNENKPAQAYFGYLNLLKLESQPPGFDEAARQMLHFLGVNWSAGTPLTVVQVMKQTPGVSSTTAHRRLKVLRIEGYVAFQIDEDDNRVKRVLPTELALAYFARMGTLLTQAARASS